MMRIEFAKAEATSKLMGRELSARRATPREQDDYFRQNA
jgi:hypothetical protein